MYIKTSQRIRNCINIECVSVVEYLLLPFQLDHNNGLFYDRKILIMTSIKVEGRKMIIVTLE